MQKQRISYTQILEANNAIQCTGEETYFLGVTRTVQESKFFPVSPYIMLGYLNAFYRYPTLLRKIEESMPAEMIGDRVRNVCSKARSMGTYWCLVNFYLLGREMLIGMGMIRPQDAAEDVAYVMDFWRRLQLSMRRDYAHVTNKEAGHRAQILPERRIQVFHADMHPCSEGDELNEAVDQFISSVSQYAVLVACESRVCMTNNGPYNLGGGKEMLVRDFYDLAEGDLPWLDGVAADVPFNRLTVVTAVKDTHFYIVDDWGSFESQPEYRAEQICGVGLYASDELTETYIPIGMNSKEELVKTLHEYTQIFQNTTVKLWERLASYSRDQLMDCGALTYYAIIRDLAHIAGVYDNEDWMKIDARAERFRPLLNDEYGNQILGALFVPLSLPAHQRHEYTMMYHSNEPKRQYSPIPFSVLTDEDYVPTVGDVFGEGITFLPEKEDKYLTTQGPLTFAEFNERVRAFTPKMSTEAFRYLDDTWVKYNYDTELARELYEAEQQYSRKLAGKGAGLTRADIDQLVDQ